MYKRLSNVLTAQANTALCGYSTIAEDIAQEAILSLIERGVDDEDTSFKLGSKIVKDLCIDHMRKEQRRGEIVQEHGRDINRTLTGQSSESLAADPFDSMTKEEALDRLCALSPLLYDTTRAHYIEGLSVVEIAKRDEITEDVVYKRLQRARDIVTGDNNNE